MLNDTNEAGMRAAFEKFIAGPPFEMDVYRFPDNHSSAWPGNYCDIDVERAWRCWEEATRLITRPQPASGEPVAWRWHDLEYGQWVYEAAPSNRESEPLYTRPQPDHFVEATEKVHLAATPAVGALRAPADSTRLDWLEAVTHKGYCPALVFDDDGHWAVLFDGVQTTPGDGPPFATSHFAGEETQWFDTVREAIDAASIAVNGEATPASSEPDGKDKDAARYDWLRNAATAEGDELANRLYEINPDPKTPAEFDAAIDAAMKDKQ